MYLLLKVKNNHLAYLILSVSSALLFILAWQPFKILPLAFIGFLPLFTLERKIRQEQANSKAWLFLYSWLAFVLWNIGSVWWIWNASEGGAIAAFIINSLPMVLPLMLFHARNRMTQTPNYWYFIACWVSIELLQFHWDLAFPWLILGNVFSYLPASVQWYEYTGVIGGSVWILLVNTKADQLLTHWPSLNPLQKRTKVLNQSFLFVIAPIFLSIYIGNPIQQTEKADIIVVQPNLDPYSEKFGGISAHTQLIEMLQQAETKMDSQVQFILLPETAIQGGLQENNLKNEALIQILQSFLQQHPYVTVISGMDSYHLFAANEPHTLTARKFTRSDDYFDAYNAAVQASFYDSLQVYHKSKLVPGVEKMPYPEVFGFIEKYAISLGGTSGSLASDGESKVFKGYQKIGMAPIICYESVFPEFTASYVKKGADILCILTNDGWWGNTPGYKQHFDYGRLRAIENRRAIARSANTGISGFIDKDGSILMESSWWQKEVLRMKVPIYKGQTFYTEHGDWLAYIFLFIFFADSLTLLVKRKAYY
ncbi:MAG: apolipoprotein N-acyltransferase [Bacteroidetes bacterium B1(2017)]|nr:MAG: apolipoprotein N-acyltransferase [Bacteroidetes bacterium B1(2017)]